MEWHWINSPLVIGGYYPLVYVFANFFTFLVSALPQKKVHSYIFCDYHLEIGLKNSYILVTTIYRG
jgi:hypothetical protein